MDNLQGNIKQCFEDKKGIVAVYLFGSYAQGRQRPSSDLDIGIVADRDRQSLIEKSVAQYIVELGRLLRKDIHPVVLNTAGEKLLRQVFSSGICVLVKNQKKLALFRMITLARVVDFAYYKQRMQSGLVKSIMKD
ncbi:MAG: nucleotidyltransferase domain-containing protein [Pseudomonadota bacterium]